MGLKDSAPEKDSSPDDESSTEAHGRSGWSSASPVSERQLRSLIGELRTCSVTAGWLVAERRELIRQLAAAFQEVGSRNSTIAPENSLPIGHGPSAEESRNSEFDLSSANPESHSARSPSPILVVDDSARNLLAFETILKPLGCPVMTATTGEEAIRLALRYDYALALCDVHMPGMNGFDLAAAFRSHPRLAEVPIIFVTAERRDFKHMFTGYARGAVDYLLTPVEPDILRAKAMIFVKLHQQQEQIRDLAARLLPVGALRGQAIPDAQRCFGIGESIPFPVWLVREDGQVRDCNAAWTACSGLKASETGMLLAPERVHPLDSERAWSCWGDGVGAPGPFDIECRLRWNLTGPFVSRRLRALPAPGENAPDRHWVVTGVDIGS